MAGFAGRDAVIVSAVRTPIGKGKAGGGLHDVLPVDLLAHSLREVVTKTGIDPAQIDDVIAGAYDIVVAAGVESMSRVPMGSSVLPGSDPFGAMAQRYPEGLVPQGISAELIAAKWGFTREQL